MVEISKPDLAKIAAFKASASSTFDWITEKDMEVHLLDGEFKCTVNKEIDIDKMRLLEGLFRSSFPPTFIFENVTAYGVSNVIPSFSIHKNQIKELKNNSPATIILFEKINNCDTFSISQNIGNNQSELNRLTEALRFKKYQ